MDRELVLEIGCEELPASWLPGLTQQIGEVVVAELKERRLPPEAPAETFSTPRRLTVRIARLAERQSDLEEVLNGPPVSASFKPDGSPTPAAAGFAAKNGVEVSALERVETAKGTYLAFRRRQRGKAAVDVLPDVLGGALRRLTFPKLMHWDAIIEDGRGELLFGRPIRWILFTYGGRVVPFTIARTSAAQTGQVQDVTTGAATYGHRFLTTSGRAGRAIKVRSFDEYRARLLENFVILERAERHNKIARELDAKAQRLQGRVSRVVRNDTGLLHEVPDLVEYPSVVAGQFGVEFLELPEEVLTTTLIHHQHYFPVEAEDGRLKNAFLAVINTEPDNERTIARNAERVVTARLRDARFFWEADRKATLESRIERLGTLLFHKKLGTYKEKSERISTLAEWIAKNSFGADETTARYAGLAARLSKADLASDMVREFTELQGIMGGVYARHEGLPEEVWKAIYFHYLPIGVDLDAPPSRSQLGRAAMTWAAVSLADKLDSMSGFFWAGERPTGSRDPLGVRRLGNGVMKILLDAPGLLGIDFIAIEKMLEKAEEGFDSWTVEHKSALRAFLQERYQYSLEQRGFVPRNVKAVVQNEGFVRLPPASAVKLLDAMKDFVDTAEFQQLAVAFKRVKNLAREFPQPVYLGSLDDVLREPAEKALWDETKRRKAAIESVVDSNGDFTQALKQAAGLKPFVDEFFDQVRVKNEDKGLTLARLWLLRSLENAVLKLADISEIVQETS